MAQKIATCCYCGTRAALELRGKVQHELACSSCGAPLHDLKMMPIPEKSDAPRHYSKPLKPKKAEKYYKKKKSKKRKSWGKKLFDEFDDIFDLFD